MDTAEAAAALNGNEYRNEGSRELFAQMKQDGLVAVFGASDDLMELRGAIDDESGAYDGGEVYVTRKGLLANRCDDEDCPYHADERKHAVIIHGFWCEEGSGADWTYQTTIPHKTFEIMEDGAVYCRGIVFALADVPSTAATAP